jgi:hypothetical protein
MVVKHPKSLENICGSLENLMSFFSSVEGGNSDPKIISMIESTLLKLESELSLSTNSYKTQRK